MRNNNELANLADKDNSLVILHQNKLIQTLKIVYNVMKPYPLKHRILSYRKLYDLAFREYIKQNKAININILGNYEIDVGKPSVYDPIQ